MATLLSSAWRPAPIATITVRQFLGGKAVRVAALLSFAPCVFALIYLMDTGSTTPRSFLINLTFRDLIAPTLLTITTLILATGALGNEIEDRTLPYLYLKPISRLRIVIEKLLGVLAVALPTILLGIIATWLIVKIGVGENDVFVSRGTPTDIDGVLWPMLAAASVGIVATAAVFLFVSLIVPRALIVGIMYAFAWESLLGRFLPGVKVISLRHYVDSIFVRMLDSRDATLTSSFTISASLIIMGATVLAAIALSTWRLSRINLE